MLRKPETSSFDESAFKAITDYYDQTRFDYWVAWAGKGNDSVHFGFYDKNATSHAAALLNTNAILAHLAKLKAGEVVLDAGCGKGGSSFWLVRNRGVHAIGISPVASQIAHAQQRAGEYGLSEETEFMQADYCATPFESERFDCVWACESLCHSADKRRFYEEAYRVLRPGGRLIIAEYMRPRPSLSALQEKLLKDWLNRWAIPDLATPNAHFQFADAAGFSQIQLMDYTQYSWVSLKNLYKISKRWIGIGQLLRSIGIRSAIQHDNHIGGIRQFEALNAGAWFYGVLLACKE